LFHNQLRCFKSAKFIYIEAIGQLHDAAIGWSCLIKRYCIDACPAGRRPHA